MCDEYVVCSLQVDANGVLCVRPDFNSGQKGYIIETSTRGRGTGVYISKHFRDIIVYYYGCRLLCARLCNISSLDFLFLKVFLYQNLLFFLNNRCK